MPRPQRSRKVCEEPEFDLFSPNGIPNNIIVTLTVDEYEVIRLIDLLQLTHLQAAKQMNISRPTATEIYNSARIKIADCIVNGKKLVVTGGNYHLCSGGICGSLCRKQNQTSLFIRKGNNTMRIAVTYENGQIFQHFGHTKEFKLYDVENNKIIKEEIVSSNGSGHGALAGFLSVHKVDVLICGGIGAGAQNALAEAGIKLYGGASGSADYAVQALLSGTLEYFPDVKCSHHSSEHNHEIHNCGSHSCENHGCH
ncbi:MAG: DUF134 domain-containing protein [Oscillospiraceae bacterium]